MCHKQRRYTSDLTDAQWAMLEPLLPVKHTKRGRPRPLDLREVLNAIFYLVKTGCQWRNLPKEFPNYNSVYYYFRKFIRGHVWERIQRALRYEDRHRQVRPVHPSAAIIDSQSVKTGARGGARGYDAGKKVKGRKRHLLVDTLGHLLKVVVHPANVQDRDGALLVLNSLTPMLHLRLRKLFADSAYDGQLVAWCADTLHIPLHIVRRPPRSPHFVLLPKRWIVERSIAWLELSRRLSKDFELLIPCSETMIYLSDIRLLLNRLAH